MNMESPVQRHMMVTLLVVCVLIIGMLLNQWIVMLYGGFVLIGCCLFASLRTLFIPTFVSLIYITLFSAMMGVHANESNTFILGWRPATFIVLFLIWPVSLILGAFYAFLFSKNNKMAWDL